MKKDYRLLMKKVDKGLQKELGRPEIKICVFLLGPGDSDESSGKSLRKYLEKKCDKYGVAVKGEHKELVRIFNERTEGLLDLCIMEDWFAREYANAVIIIPYSAGSLVEMGMFTWKPEICSKTMLILSEEFPEEKESFINQGTSIHYRAKGGTVTSVDYTKKRKIWKEVWNFLLKYKAEKYEEVLLKQNG